MSVRTYRRPPRLIGGYARAALPALPVIGRLPGVRKIATRAPERRLNLTGVRIADERLGAYQHVCGFPRSEWAPATYVHVLAFPLQLALMNDSAFPFAPMGVVHVANTIDVRRGLSVGQRVDLCVEAQSLRPHRRGRLIDLVTTARLDGQVVWLETSTMLGRGGPRQAEPTTEPAAAPAPDPACSDDHWSLPADLGRRYARVSGDVNPIHLSRWTARPFGFRQAIAHGMWTLARCLAALEQQDERRPEATRLAVEFTRPIPLPGEVGFGSRTRDGTTDFAVASPRQTTTRPYLTGRLSTAP